MSDTAKRDAVLEEFRIDRQTAIAPGVTRITAGHDGHAMADEIIRLRAAIERVRATCENELRWIDAQPILRALEETP